MSLKSLACSALRLHPLPASTIPLYDCRKCTLLLGDEKDRMGPDSNVFFIHLHGKEIDDRTKRMSQSTEYQFKKALSSMRNSGASGVLFVHTCEPYSGVFESAVIPILCSMLTDDERISDGFRWKRVACRNATMHKIDVLPSEMFLTADMKSKMLVWSDNNQVSASFEKLRPLLLSKRKVSTKEPAVQGLSRVNQVDAVRIYVDKSNEERVNYSLLALNISVSTWVNRIINVFSLPEYVTSISKGKQGASVYVGRRNNYNGEMEGVTFPGEGNKREWQRMLAEELQKKISVLKNRYSDVILNKKNVFQIEIHETGRNSGVIEVAVRPVNGCVFHDALGPASFRIEDTSIAKHHYRAFVRLSFEEWMEKALV
ncbi:uncharacterized protein LOC124257838 [Haliotis rubra]|uniref:uncharacterized protein LOC124257838 n=1 Tax=Haliotis rubra TaxID=36100 RepID=UPI001EE5EC2A|nr:uncharacterized protein LOC124257838 [Haliotis rubra]